MNRVQEHDVNEFVNSFKLSDQLANKTFLVTGATGLIGSMLIHCLIALKQNINILLLVRNKYKAYQMFSQEEQRALKIIECNLVEFDYSTLTGIDYIIHCAAPTSSKYFIEKPIETVDIILKSTQKLLNYAKSNSIKGFVFLSSLEVYGSIGKMDSVIEDIQGFWSITDVRSCYPIAKRMAEHLCFLFSKEYGVPVKIARLTQTTGAGIAPDDNRIIAQFARKAVKSEDIILHTLGKSARPYCYTTDAISAIIYILLKGENGEPYNVANPDTYVSARDLADYVKTYFNPDINVRIEIADNMGYAPDSYLPLSTEKLEKLGWKPKYGLYEIFKNLIDCMSTDKGLNRYHF